MLKPFAVKTVGHGRSAVFDVYDTDHEAVAVAKALWRLRALGEWSAVKAVQRRPPDKVLWHGGD